MTENNNTSVVIMMPVYNDWGPFRLLLDRLNHVLTELDYHDIRVLAIDDGSSETYTTNNDESKPYSAIGSVDILHLACNLGSQRCIAVGLAYIANEMKPDVVVVMDADGEDKPEDVLGLLQKHKESPDKLIVARRARRSEPLLFRIFYALYKILFRCLTGRQISFGNFCLVPFGTLTRLVYRPELWNNLPATLIRSGLPMEEIATARGNRLMGTSSMKTLGLIIHGLSAIAVYSDVSLLRILLGCLFLSVSTIAGIVTVAVIRLGTDLAIPGWASNVAGSLLIILLQSAMISILVIFLILNNRTQHLMVPNLHYTDYISDLENIR